ncbi:MAG: hypothetical protein V4702_01915 [Patescibacteria group bacterium]
MGAFEEQPCVGLFGTCGDSTFRQDLFIPEYERMGIPYYNPQKKPGTWSPEDIPLEADHINYDVVQDWPVTDETYGTGSLSEQGYSVANSIRGSSPLPKFVVAMIAPDLDVSLDDTVARQESIRARKLSATHLERQESPNVFVVDSLDEMVETSVVLYEAAVKIVYLVKEHNPAFKRFIAGRNEAEVFRQALESGQLGSGVANIVK